jgi:hypothetical protein
LTDDLTPAMYSKSRMQLMELHLATLYTYNDRGRCVAVNQWDGGAAARLHLGRTSEGNSWRFRADLPEELVSELSVLCESEPNLTNPAELPRHHSRYLDLLARYRTVSRVSSGPTYWFSSASTAHPDTVAISAENADLLVINMNDWSPDVPHRNPFLVMTESGNAVSVCASVRITDSAHAAGVETVLGSRKQGHAVKVVASWAHAVQQLGAVALYSTSWDNEPSQKVANGLGLEMFGSEYSIF